MASDPRLRALLALRKLAEEQARERVVTFARLEGADCAPDGDVATIAAVELALLADLSRPASRDAVARAVAEALLIPVEFSAPSLWRMAATVWAFTAMSDCSDAVKNDGVWLIPTPGSTADRIRSVPALAGVTDPAEALTLIALAVLGGAS